MYKTAVTNQMYHTTANIIYIISKIHHLGYNKEKKKSTGVFRGQENIWLGESQQS